MAIRREAAEEAEAATTQLLPRGGQGKDGRGGGRRAEYERGFIIFSPNRNRWNGMHFHMHSSFARNGREGREMMEAASYEGACKYVYGHRLKGGP